jgi:hypothetical protein
MGRTERSAHRAGIRKQPNGLVIVSRSTVSVFPPTILVADALLSTLRPAMLIETWLRLKKRIFDPYHPERHYMRGPGPKWREKHGQAGR